MKPSPRPASGSYAVLCTKSSGARVVFNVCRDQSAAERLVTQLAAIGCEARAVRALPGDVPGLQRRPRGARVPS
jgi:hypothetical protein